RNLMLGETRPPGLRSELEEASSLAALVRRHDRNRYQTALFAPAGRREALFALYAFNHEIARVRESVTQPMLGQIRLQWWREVIDGAYAGAAPRRHEVAEPLTAAIRDFRLSRGHFDRIIDAREADLADEPRAALPALLPAVIADRVLARLRRAGWDPFDPGLAAADTLQSWRLAAAALRGRF